MRYQNPILKGFYPDPSVCRGGDGKFYMVCSSFQYFPGVPLFVSDNLVNWQQIGHVLTRKSQIMLEKINSSGGVFAPTIRYCDGRYYMVTTNDTTHQNFYVYTDDIYGEWSEPIYVEQGGIDPSLYFEDGHTYFMSNGCDDDGVSGVVQCEINVETGEKLTSSKTIWQGSGGRYLESPHLYCISGNYYLMAAEGGTEYGHMITYAKGDSVWGPFENYPKNPVLTNRNKAPEIIQGIGHGDLIQDDSGNWHILSLGFRQLHIWMPYHHLGREVFLTPVTFGGDGWFTAGLNGTTDASYEMEGDFEQDKLQKVTFNGAAWNKYQWIHLRHPNKQNYEVKDGELVLHGCDITLEEADSPTFLGIRQRDFNMNLSVNVSIDVGEAGVTCYMCEQEHYDIAIRRRAEEYGTDEPYEAVLKLNIGGIKHVQTVIPLREGRATLMIRSDHYHYYFYVKNGNEEEFLGIGQAKYLSSEVSGGFTGVVIGLYAVGRNTANFTDFSCEYTGDEE